MAIRGESDVPSLHPRSVALEPATSSARQLLAFDGSTFLMTVLGCHGNKISAIQSVGIQRYPFEYSCGQSFAKREGDQTCFHSFAKTASSQLPACLQGSS